METAHNINTPNGTPCKSAWTLEFRCKWIRDVREKSASLNMSPADYIQRQVARDLYPIDENNFE